MWIYKRHTESNEKINGLVAVAIDKEKGSQNALKWAVDNLLQKGQTVILIHVKLKTPPSRAATLPVQRTIQIYNNGLESPLECRDPDPETKEVFVPFRVFCTCKNIQCNDIILEDVDVAKALIEYVSHAAIEHLVIGSSTKTAFFRFKVTDIPGTVAKGAPDFCSVYVINKGKIQSMRSASRPAPIPPLCDKFREGSMRLDSSLQNMPLPYYMRGPEQRTIEPPHIVQNEIESFSSLSPGRDYSCNSYRDTPNHGMDTSCLSSGRTSLEIPSSDNPDAGMNDPPTSYASDIDMNPGCDSMQFDPRSTDTNSPSELSLVSQEYGDGISASLQTMEDLEAEMRRLKMQFQKTLQIYSTACREALTAKQQAIELQRWKLEEERRLKEARHSKESTNSIVEKERAKSKAAMESAEAARRIAELEAQKRIQAEMRLLKESEEKKRALDALAHMAIRYRRYTIEEIEAATEFFAESRKIGEGGYGPVFKCNLDHTSVAVKVLRPDAVQGRSQFQQEVEVLSYIRHPNMVLLLGACPEYGCLVYEFMANGSLDDRLFRRGNTPILSWELRFKIAAEIGTGLLFLHRTKPEPLVHRDLKPANILLDSNFTAKISDVGLARLVPPSVADRVTQYRITSAAGTFCYIDPEYQQTGMLGVKSDIYSLGILFLQILTAKPPMGLTHQVQNSIEQGTFEQMLDPSVTDWPIEEALTFAKLAIKCSELRRKDRPDLSKIILPELKKLKEFAESTMQPMIESCGSPPPTNNQVSMALEGASGPIVSGVSLKIDI